MTLKNAAILLETTIPTATKAVQLLVDIGILHETTGKRRDRLFHHFHYLECLKQGTEL